MECPPDHAKTLPRVIPFSCGCNVRLAPEFRARRRRRRQADRKGGRNGTAGGDGRKEEPGKNRPRPCRTPPLSTTKSGDNAGASLVPPERKSPHHNRYGLLLVPPWSAGRFRHYSFESQVASPVQPAFPTGSRVKLFPRREVSGERIYGFNAVSGTTYTPSSLRYAAEASPHNTHSIRGVFSEPSSRICRSRAFRCAAASST